LRPMGCGGRLSLLENLPGVFG